MELHYQKSGAGFPLVFLHGLSDDLSIWLPLINKFEKDYFTLALDLPGHGSSSEINNDFNLDSFNDTLIEFLKNQGIEKAHFIGFSWGSAILLKLACDAPHLIKSITIISGFSQVDHNLKFQLNNFKEKLKENYEAFFDEAVQVVNTPEFLSENKIALEEFKVLKAKTASINSLISTIDVILNFDISEELSKIKCPVLIFSGSEDKLTSIELSKIMQESLADSRWIILKGEGHNLFVPSRITELEEYIQEFLENQG
ncbi:alpha/beta hydrolase [Methanobacterium movens]